MINKCTVVIAMLFIVVILENMRLVIPAIKSAANNSLNFNPNSDSVINPSDTLIGFGTLDQQKQLRKMCT